MVEWKYPHADSSPPRVERILQRRICFTELAPSELHEHANVFGHFAIEFDVEVLKRMGAMPVFYIPRGMMNNEFAAPLGSVILIQLLDASNLIKRLAWLDSLRYKSHNPMIDFEVKYPENPIVSRKFELNIEETLKSIEAISHGLSPLTMLSSSVEGVLNLFYPADNTYKNESLGYYHQREWRIAGGIAINGIDLMRPLLSEERNVFIEIDSEFFQRKMVFIDNHFELIDECSLYTSLGGKHVLDLANRIIVPAIAIQNAREALSKLNNKLPIVSLEEL